ncbi:MAG: radical SAM protein [bacterium]|nr:radical SAM protein [bacterium]
MRILLISAQNSVDTIGLKYLHYCLLANGHHSSILYTPALDLRDGSQLAGIGEFAEKFNPGLIGFSLMSNEYDAACILTMDLKKRLPSVPVMWGGIHPTIEPESCLDYADYVCIGEGERTILEMADAVSKGRDVRAIRNLCYAGDGGIERNPLHPLIDDLDSLPVCDHMPRDSFILLKRTVSPLTKRVFRKFLRWSGTTYSVLTSRGCPFSCTYCCNNFITRLYGKRRVRRRSVENVIGELERTVAENPEIEIINIQDDAFLMGDNKYIEAFAASYKRRVARPFVARAIPLYVTRGNMTCLKDAGLAWVAMGLQSGSDRTCAEIYKRMSFREDFLRATQIIHELDLPAFYDVILDNPFETKDDAILTAETLMRAPKPFYTQFFSLALYCGTELFEKARVEFPDHVTDWRSKNYNYPQKSERNRLIRLAAYLSEERMNGILHLYRNRPDSCRFKVTLRLAGLMSAFVYEPLTNFQLLRKSFGGSLWKTLKHIYLYWREGIIHYINQFAAR